MIHAIVPGLENLKCPKVKEPSCGSLTLGRRLCDFGSLTLLGRPLFALNKARVTRGTKGSSKGKAKEEVADTAKRKPG